MARATPFNGPQCYDYYSNIVISFFFLPFRHRRDFFARLISRQRSYKGEEGEYIVETRKLRIIINDGWVFTSRPTV